MQCRKSKKAFLASALILVIGFMAVAALAQQVGGPYSPDNNTAALLHLDGNLTDVSGKTHDGTLYSGGSNAWVGSAKFGGGLDTNGSPPGGFYVYVGYPGYPEWNLGVDPSGTGYSVEGWFKPSALPDAMYLLGGPMTNFFTRVRSTGSMEVGIMGPSGWVSGNTDPGLAAAGQWIHVALTSHLAGYQENFQKKYGVPPMQCGWEHASGVNDAWGWIASGHNGTFIFGGLGVWSHAMLDGPQPSTNVIIGATLGDCVGTSHARFGLSNDTSKNWTNPWQGFGPMFEYHYEGGVGTATVYAPQANGAASQSVAYINTAAPTRAYLIIKLDTSTGLGDLYHDTTDPANRLISGFNMKGSWTLDQFKSNIGAYKYVCADLDSSYAEIDNIVVTGVSSEGDTSKLYVNNQLKLTIPVATAMVSSFAVGRVPWDQTGEGSLVNAFQGQIDEFRVSYTARTGFENPLYGIGGPYPDGAADTVALYHLDNETDILNTVATDSSVNGFNGILYGVNTWLSSAMYGGGILAGTTPPIWDPGNSVAGGFDADYTTGNYTGGVSASGNGFSVEGWFNPSAPLYGDVEYIIGGDVGATAAFFTRLHSNGSLDLGVVDNGWVTGSTPPGTLIAGTWTHLALACKISGASHVSKLYINNVLALTIAGAPSGFNHLAVGVCPWDENSTAAYYEGLMDEIKISNVARTNFSTTVSAAATPAFSPDGGTFQGSGNVVVTCTTPGAVIHYTTNGVDPTTSDPVIASGSSISVTQSLTLKAMAVATGYATSAVASGYFRIVTAALNSPQMIGVASGITVDGSISDWSSSDFVPMTYRSEGNNAADVAEAYYAAKWSPVTNRIYVAVKVRDTAYHLENAWNNWYTNDHVEVYIHTGGSGPVDQSGLQDVAQQYCINIMNSSRSTAWAYMGNGGAIPSANTSQFAGNGINSQWLYYEAALVPYTSQTSNLITALQAGEIIGLDVRVLGNDGTLTQHTSGLPGYTGAVAENSMGSKAYDYTTIGLHVLVGNTPPVSLATLKNTADNTAVVSAGIITASFGGYFYIESTDRTSGIRVQKAGYTATVGNTATVLGTIRTNNASGERYLDATTVVETTGTALKPLGLTNKTAGGGSNGLQAGVTNGSGLNNIGLLVKTTGRVSNGSGSRFQIDDGSGVLINAVVSSGGIPANGSYVTVAGIASCEIVSGVTQRLILVKQYQTVN